MAAMLDGFLLATVAGTVLTSMLPRILHDGDWLALAMLVIGFTVPGQVEHLFARGARGTHRVTLVLAFLGLCIHQMLDGGALAFFSRSNGGDSLIASGVVLHQVPVGLLVWWVLRRRAAVVPALLLFGLGALIVVGYGLQVELGSLVPDPVSQLFAALIGGSLLHVLGHDPAAHDDEPADEESPRNSRRLGALGAIIGLAVLLLVGRTSQAIEGDVTTGAFVDRFMVLALEAAPALLVAYLVAGLLSLFAPASPGLWLGRGSAWPQAVRGVLVGLRLPMCSRPVVPFYRTLVNGGASAAGTMAFLIAGPELGVDAISLSVLLLGTEFTVIRVVATVAVALLVGWWVGGTVKRRGLLVMDAHPHDTRSFQAKLLDGLKEGFGENVDRTAPWVLLGVIIAAMLGAEAIGRLVTALPRGADVVLLALIGIPIYISASAATPLVAVVVAAGVSPGAGLAFLITGPVDNLTTFGVLGQIHGRRTAIAFGGAVLTLSVGLGFLVNAAFPGLHALPLAAGPAEAATPLRLASLIAVGLLVLASLWRTGVRGFLAELSFGTREGAHADEHAHAH